MFTRVRLVGLLVLLASIHLYASVFGTVKAIVHDPQHRPVKGAQVVVHSRTSSLEQRGITNEDGVALVMKVPVGEYDITILSPGFTADPQSATVISDGVQELHFALTLAARQETVEVSAEPQIVNPSSSTPETLVSRSEIEKSPGSDRTNSMSMITNYVPGSAVVHD